uniref:Serpin family A member 1 n=1 Tax=Pipistrellus kuhlii TaxID=59472 RepID=A0A7J7RA86_PIPKU|nr:serpin family A member 1 [Pipistrellus kuhlii]
MPSSVTWGLLLLAGLCCLAPAARAGDAAQDTDAAEHAQESASHKIAPNLADFAFSLYRQVAHQSEATNIFFSPVSIATAFAMISLGAEGTTRTQLLEGLHLDLKEVPEAAIYTGLLNLLHSINKSDSEPWLITGNILFANLSVKFKDEFLKYVWELRHSDVFCLRFRDAKARTKVNNFIEMKIQEKDLDLFEEFDKDTTLILVDYIVFEGLLEVKLEPETFVVEDFHVDKKTMRRMFMFRRSGQFELLHDEALSSWVLLQRYRGPVPAFLILPDEGKMQHLEAEVSQEHLTRIFHSMAPCSASLYMPKLYISGTYDLKATLGKMGITKVFNDEAELSGISEGQPLKLSKALHEARLIIDEIVTDHSDARPLGKHRSNLLTVKFNRPFLVILMDKSFSIPLFLGKMVDPE